MTERDLPARLIELVAELVRELRPAARGIEVRPESRLEEDLGIDSLGRVELAHRLEHAFEVRLDAERITAAETVADLLEAVTAAAGRPVETAALSAVAQAAGDVALPHGAKTLFEVLAFHAARHPERVHCHLLDIAGLARPIAYGRLEREAARISAGLARHGVGPGDRVVVMMPTSLAFLASFFAVLRLGAVVAPVYPPARPRQIEEHLRRLRRILENAEPRALLVTPEFAEAGRLAGLPVPGLRVVVVDEAFGAGLPEPPPHAGTAEELALLQYTSGSTGDPKGVMLTHANLLANIRAIGRALDASPADVCVSWLPLYHDMGLIGAWLGSLWHAATLVLMPPQRFLARPAEWILAMSRARATVSAAPNFAWELAIERVPERALEGVDLSSLRALANGAEPVRPETLRRFIAKYAPYGLKPEAVMPVYGLAENAVALCFPPLGRGPRFDRIRREPFQRSGRAEPAGPGESDVLEFVSCGRPVPGHDVRVVDGAGVELPERTEGRIQFRGPSATAGYFRHPGATRRLFHRGWLDSGDLGYLADGELFVTGRVKDLILRAGRNIHAEDVERAVDGIDGVRKGCVAAVGVPGPEGTERLVVLAETRITDPQARDGLVRRIERAVAEAIGEPPDSVVPLPPHSLPRTSSGKIRRGAAKQLLLEGRLGQAVSAAPAVQRLHLIASGLAGRIRRLAAGVPRLLSTLRFWSAIALAAPVFYAAGLLVRDPLRQHRPLARIARIGLRLAGVRIAREGRLPAGPALVVANHASYVDGAVLIAALDRPLAFVAKAELEGHPLAGPFLRALGCIFVARGRTARLPAESLRRALESGRVPVVFPEGTFVREPGLLPFRLGGFLAAAQLGVPVVPVALVGTRAVLRDEAWLAARPGPVRVEVGPPILPAGTGFEEARRLSAEARAFILERLGEPDLDHVVVLGPGRIAA
ncbi:Long-chain-fatty-acid--AMP ligase FadD26 [bacterium HR39]|nr:Long-chain-fatty-acid--AMP ligase FadD26 [bacterium HR39]